MASEKLGAFVNHTEDVPAGHWNELGYFEPGQPGASRATMRYCMESLADVFLHDVEHFDTAQVFYQGSHPQRFPIARQTPQTWFNQGHDGSCEIQVSAKAERSTSSGQEIWDTFTL